MTEVLVQAIEGGAINTWVLSTYWLWPLLEIIHFIGLSLLLGSILLVDLRLAGFLRQIDLKSTHRLLPWAVIGFVMNLRMPIFRASSFFISSLKPVQRITGMSGRMLRSLLISSAPVIFGIV